MRPVDFRMWRRPNPAISSPWLEGRNLQASRRAAKAIFDALDQLSAFPESAPAISEFSRENFVDFGRDGYILRYEVKADRIVVLHVFQGREDT